MNARAVLVLVGAVLGCGGAEDQMLEDQLVADGIIAPPSRPDEGQLRQEYSARITQNRQWGVTDTHARKACNRTSTNQWCTVLGVKNVVYHLQNLDRPELVRNLFNRLDDSDQFDSWNFVETQSINDATVIVTEIACAGGPDSVWIESYGCMTPTGTTNLTEGSGVVGFYTRHDWAVAKIDRADINARYSTEQKRARAYLQAAGHAVLAALGTGSRNDASLNSIESEQINGANPIVAEVSAGTACRGHSFSGMGTDTFTIPPVGGLCSTGE